METKDKILEILSKGYLVTLATTDEAGPWAADVIYTYDDDLNIYWMSYPNVRHSQAIEKNGQTAGTITVTCYGETPELGIQFSGKAEKLETLKHELVVKYCVKNEDPIPKEGDDVLKGHSWYVLHPSMIELIDTEHYGYKKQKLDL